MFHHYLSRAYANDSNLNCHKENLSDVEYIYLSTVGAYIARDKLSIFPNQI